MSWRSVMMAMVCLPAVICAVILLFRQTEKAASRFLAAFILVAVLSMGPQIIGYAGFYDVWPGLTFFPLFYTEAWLGPLLFLHADRLMRSGPYGWKKLLVIPGLVQLIYYTWAFFGLGDYQSKWAYSKSFHSPYIIPFESAVEIGFIVISFIAVWRLSQKYRRYLENTSSAAMDFDPNWLRNIIIGIGLAGGIYAVLELVIAMKPISYNAAFPFQVIIMAIVAWLALDAAWRLTKPYPKMPLVPDSVSTPTDMKDWTKEAEILSSRIMSEKWYLEAGLSIRDIAHRMGTNETYLSRSLNRGLGISFNKFINQFRIDHAKLLIGSSDNSMLGIALDSGFNSKATFNRVFRDIAGMTPTQFKKSQKP